MTSFEIEKTPYFDMEQTLNCGQVFRFIENGGGFRILAENHIAQVRELSDRYEINCDDAAFFENYFDLNTDYAEIQAHFSDDALVSEAIEFGRGIHILKQNPLEMIFSFLISQNNHIPRIKGIIERLCAALGEDMGGYYAFPTLTALAGKDEAFYASIGAGYRAAYLARTAQELKNTDLSALHALDTLSLRQELMKLHGVGRKVADCILLFGFNRFDVFPVDTWIKKVYKDEYPSLPAEKLSALLVEKYGNYAGFAQQWLFYSKREKKV